jgi:hypothetical protein
MFHNSITWKCMLEEGGALWLGTKAELTQPVVTIAAESPWITVCKVWIQ